VHKDGDTWFAFFWLALVSSLAPGPAGLFVVAQALRLNVHFHTLWADGVFGCAPGSLRAKFHAHGDLTDEDVEQTLRAIARRVRRWLHKHGKLREQDGEAVAEKPAAAEPTLLETLGAAAAKA
jgi:hypothetical protein